MQTIDVTIVDSIGSVKRSAGLPDDVQVGKLTAALVKKLGLPMTGANGRPISYYLNLVRSGTSTQLDEESTLAQAGVETGDILRINAQIQTLDEDEKEKVPRGSFTSFRCFKIGGICPKDIKMDERFVFVAMPFGEEHNNVYQNVIKPLLSELKYECNRADEVKFNIDIMCKICQLIQKAGVNIVDITHWNPNVILELGMMYGMGKTAILLKHKKADVPVDLKGMEYIEYENFNKLRNDLAIKLLKGSDPVLPFIGKKCAYCHLFFKKGDNIVTCEYDNIPHHLKCWEENEGCIVCQGTNYSFKR